MKIQKTNESKAVRPSSSEELIRKTLIERFKNTPIPDDQILENLELYMRPQRISEIFSLHQIYMKILNVQGIVVEFGVRWGRHLSVFSALRAIYEPYNFYRKIVGFDTFSGFLQPDKIDGNSDKVYKGSMSVSLNYEEYLSDVLKLHEAEAPLAHLNRTELYKGDASIELKRYLSNNPATIIALAYFDMDLYKPTKECLEIILPFLTKGSVLAFDELCHPEFPGETIALKEILNIREHEIKRFTTAPYPCYIVI
jgi:hypothetical protein